MLFSSEFVLAARRRRDRVPTNALPKTRSPMRPNTALMRAGFSGTVATADSLVIMIGAFAASFINPHGADHWDAMTSGVVIAALFVLVNLLRNDYALSHYLVGKQNLDRAFTAWTIAFGAALTLGFMTKTSAVFSRGALGIFFVLGFVALMVVRRSIIGHIRAGLEAGRFTSRTVMLVGDEKSINCFTTRYQPLRYGIAIVEAAVIRDEADSLMDDLSLAVATARMRRPDEVFLLLPWSDPDRIATCTDMFRRLPAAIHLGPAGFMERLDDLRIDKTGPISSVHLVRRPLSTLEIATKRVFDFACASLILAILSPLLAIVALAIKLESRGPVFFMQRRYGFNQEPFRIIKFRSMATMEDDSKLKQVTSGDKRVTRIGRLIRRTSIDELPQLINVLRGDMSLVGPRPHALAHDQLFERTIALYARRHNVRPGITGWAQVRGFRGETDTPEKIQGRVEHDLFYIDNWSMWFDVDIMLRTVFSSDTHRNAK